MKTTIQELEEKYVAFLEGELDTAAAIEVEKKLQPLYNSNGRDVIIDCTKLEYIASSGLRILISILKGAKAGGSKVIMRNMNDDIKNVFKLTGFINLFEFEDA
jgi:anti-sigma B factor antagonist